jgi:hypothetical protein
MESAAERHACELLGVGADARLLVLNCDDLGMYRAVNLGIVEAVRSGVATTCSLMTPCPGATQAIELLRQRPRIPFGIHLTVVCDLPGHRWGPLASKEKVPSLLDGDGELFGLRQLDELMAQAQLDELELEFDHRAGRHRAPGLPPPSGDLAADLGRERWGVIANSRPRQSPRVAVAAPTVAVDGQAARRAAGPVVPALLLRRTRDTALRLGWLARRPSRTSGGHSTGPDGRASGRPTA